MAGRTDFRVQEKQVLLAIIRMQKSTMVKENDSSGVEGATSWMMLQLVSTAALAQPNNQHVASQTSEEKMYLQDTRCITLPCHSCVGGHSYVDT